MNKTQFLNETKVKLNLSKHKIRRFFEIGAGRFWNIERQPEIKNSYMVTPKIQLSSYPPPIGIGKLENTPPSCPEGKNQKDLQSRVVTELSSYPDPLWKTGQLAPREGVI